MPHEESPCGDNRSLLFCLYGRKIVAFVLVEILSRGEYVVGECSGKYFPQRGAGCFGNVQDRVLLQRGSTFGMHGQWQGWPLGLGRPSVVSKPCFLAARRECEAVVNPPLVEVGTVEGVAFKLASPGLLHVGDGLFKAVDRLWTEVGAAGKRFQMRQFRLWRPDDLVPVRSDLQTEIDVVEGDWKMLLVESAHLVKHAPAHRQAGGRDRRHVAGDPQVVEVAGGIGCRLFVGMPGHRFDRSHAENHTCMLNRAIVVEKLGTDGSHLRPHSLRYHCREPARMADQNVVVEQQQDLAPRFANRLVVDR